MATSSTDHRQIAKAWTRAYGAHHRAAAPDEVEDWASRAQSDVRAAWHRWHRPDLTGTWSPSQWPWYEALERARVEQLACNDLAGMARNLADPETTAPGGRPGALYCAARRVFAGDVEAIAGDLALILELKPRWHPGRWFARQSALPAKSDIVTGLRQAAELLDEPIGFSRCIEPIVRAMDDRYAIANGVGRDNAQISGSVPVATEVGGEEREVNGADSQSAADSASMLDLAHKYPDYSIYCASRDEQFPAVHWLEPEDNERVRSLMAPDRRQIRRLAHRMQRQLQSAQLRRWEFDQIDGRLDSRRLARLVTDRHNQRVFRREGKATAPSACVSFLVDLSGSMRGERQRMAAMTVDLAIHTLELCGIECEVLGYTTTHGSGNPVETLWQRSGAPEQPGRLNALRHVIFKTTREPWRRTRPGLGLMLREDFGRENIDGEAVHWAARRIGMHPAEKKLLIVLSDGIPHDSATANANGRSFLSNHLHDVIEQVEASGIEIFAIGANRQIGQFYRDHFMAREPEGIPSAIFHFTANFLVQNCVPRDKRSSERP